MHQGSPCARAMADTAQPPARLGSGGQRRWRDMPPPGSPSDETCLATAIGILGISSRLRCLDALPPSVTARGGTHRLRQDGAAADNSVTPHVKGAPNLASASHDESEDGCVPSIRDRPRTESSLHRGDPQYTRPPFADRSSRLRKWRRDQARIDAFGGPGIRFRNGSCSQRLVPSYNGRWRIGGAGRIRIDLRHGAWRMAIVRKGRML